MNTITTPPVPAAPKQRRRWPWAVGGAVAVLAIIGAIVGDGQVQPTDAAAPVTEPTFWQEPETTELPEEVAAPVEAPVAESSVGVMPDVVCLDLQTAQDTIQATTELFWSDSRDATGEDRMQLIDSNWLVVRQYPAAGTELSEDDTPMLDVLKYGEGSCR